MVPFSVCRQAFVLVPDWLEVGYGMWKFGRRPSISGRSGTESSSSTHQSSRWTPRAHFADAEEDDDIEEEGSAGNEEHEDATYALQHTNETGSDANLTLDDEVEAVEADAYTTMVDNNCTASAENVAEVAQCEVVAMFAWNKFGKGRIEGSCKMVKEARTLAAEVEGFKMARSSVPLEERRSRLKELKSKTECLDCGQVGHWAGDAECPSSRKHDSGNTRVQRPSAHMASMTSMVTVHADRPSDHACYNFEQYHIWERRRRILI